MDRNPALDEIAQFLRRLQWAAVVVATLWLVWVLSPVLTPFVFAALIGWLGDPLVDRLERSGWSRNSAVMLVFGAMSLVALIALALLIPAIEHQIRTLVEGIPRYRTWVETVGVPWVEGRFRVEISQYFDLNYLSNMVRSDWARAGGVAQTVWAYLSQSGFALLGFMTNLVLIPVLAFFFLRDWDVLLTRIASLVPRDHLTTVSRLANESSDVLGAFLRGQFLVMITLGVMYGLGLWAVGIDLGILIGLIAGILTFVPYLGPTSGIVLGCIAALVQYGDWKHIAGVLVVFGVGQVIESYWLTPKLVGDRIGLHPMAVIFAVLAGGTLFGFLGMLLALPVAAVINVLLRYAQERYTASKLYAGDAPSIVLDTQAPSLVEHRDAV